MHELSFANEIITVVQKEMVKRGLKGVKEISICLGALTGVDPEALSFCFESATIDSPLKNTRLIINQIPVKGKCYSCGKNFQIDDFVFLCPDCDSTNIDVTQGEELNIEYLVEE